MQSFVIASASQGSTKIAIMSDKTPALGVSPQEGKDLAGHPSYTQGDVSAEAMELDGGADEETSKAQQSEQSGTEGSSVQKDPLKCNSRQDAVADCELNKKVDNAQIQAADGHDIGQEYRTHIQRALRSVHGSFDGFTHTGTVPLKEILGLTIRVHGVGQQLKLPLSAEKTGENSNSPS
jgi:hypothetical protein